MDIIEKITGNISENTACWNAVESAIEECGVDIPEGTPKTDYADKVAEVFEAGKKSEYDAFWDEFQQNGNRTDYKYAFGGCGWNADTFKPKYKIAPTVAYDSFRDFNNNAHGDEIVMDMSNIEIDFSNITDATNIFNSAFIKNLFCDFGNVTTAYYALGSAHGGFCDNITIRISEKCTNLSYMFAYQGASETLVFTEDSVIAANLNVRWSTKLNRRSIESIVNALSTTTTGLSVTLSSTAVTNAFGSVDNVEWKALVESKPNWTISLV